MKKDRAEYYIRPMYHVLPPAAMTYLQRALLGENLINHPLHPNCEAAVLVPVMREPVKRVLNLLESLAAQIEVPEGAFEVLAVINRPTDNGSTDSKLAALANQAVLDLPVWRNRDPFEAAHKFSPQLLERCRKVREGVAAYAIDKSTPGNEIPDNNIGKARNRALAEGSLRFSRVGKNGLLIFTDADARFHDPRHIAKALALFESDPDMIAAAGGVDFVFDPDTEDPEMRSLLKNAYEQLMLWKRWQHLERFAKGEEVSVVPEGAFFGNHMLTRSSVAAEIGGIPYRAEFEDSVFGLRLSQYAETQEKRVGNMSRSLRVQSALRESDRSWSTFSKEVLDRVGLLPILIEDPFDPGKQHVLTEEFYAMIRLKLEAEPQGKKLVQALDDIGRAIYTDAFPRA